MLVLLLSCFPAAAAVAFLGVAAAFAGFGAFACASGASVDDDDEAGAFAGKANCGGQFGVVTASVLAGPVWKPTGGGVCDLDLGDCGLPALGAPTREMPGGGTGLTGTGGRVAAESRGCGMFGELEELAGDVCK